MRQASTPSARTIVAADSFSRLDLRDRDVASHPRATGAVRIAGAHRTVRGRHDDVAADRPVAPGNVHGPERTTERRSACRGIPRPRAAASVAPYLREGLAEVRTFASDLPRTRERLFDTLEHVRTHAAARRAAGLPPAASCRCSFFLMAIPASRAPTRRCSKDLASHGYAVCSIVHPYEASAATLADGRVVTMLDSSGSRFAGRLPTSSASGGPKTRPWRR